MCTKAWTSSRFLIEAGRLNRRCAQGGMKNNAKQTQRQATQHDVRQRRAKRRGMQRKMMQRKAMQHDATQCEEKRSITQRNATTLGTPAFVCLRFLKRKKTGSHGKYILSWIKKSSAFPKVASILKLLQNKLSYRPRIGHI